MPPAENLPPAPEVRFARKALKWDKRVFKKYGYTKGCAVCTATKAGRTSHRIPHPDRCRARFDEEMRHDKDDVAEVEAATKRTQENERQK